MKLNYDCVRMLLICLENNLNYDDSLAHSSINLSDILTSSSITFDVIIEITKAVILGYFGLN